MNLKHLKNNYFIVTGDNYKEKESYYKWGKFKIFKKTHRVDLEAPEEIIYGIKIYSDKKYLVEHPQAPGRIWLTGDIIVRQATGRY